MRAAAAAALLLAVPAAAQEGPVVVHLADGTTLPMVSWTLAYEYGSWRQGESPALGALERQEARELWLGKKAHSLAGATLEFEYDIVEKAVEQMEGGTKAVRMPVVRGLTLTGAQGSVQKLKPEAPHRDHFPAEKARLVQARSLDLHGQTLTGTRRSFCILSYSALVQCYDSVGQQVVKLEFPK
jgi:hypothetical protein